MGWNHTPRPASLVLAGPALALFASTGPADAQGHGFDGPHLPHGGGRGSVGRSGGIGRARAAIYDIIVVSGVTDAAGLKTTMAKLGPSLAGTGGRLLVDADPPTALSGSAASYIAVVIFDDVFSAMTLQKSATFKSLVDEFAKEGTLQVAASGGIADPGAPPAVPETAFEAGPGRNKPPEMPKIADICKGC